MTKQELKLQVAAAIDAAREELFQLGDAILAKPEMGYKEFSTADLTAKAFEKLGIPYRDKVAVTGLIGDLQGRKNLGRVAMLGELDAVLCPTHPFADPVTGAAHACGHNAMITALIGVATGLKNSGAMDYLDGAVSLMAVPAEEPVELEFRQGLMKEKQVEFLGGKQEFIALGEFDPIDAAVMMHTQVPPVPGVKTTCTTVNNGFVAKLAYYKGKEAHAGGAPHLGVNALNAATLGLTAIHMNRETFKDEDHIRVHPIMTKGGDLVNIVPADVRIETFVRGSNMPAIFDANRKVNRALRAGADAVGAEVEIVEFPGYLEMYASEPLTDLYYENAKALFGDKAVLYNGGHGSGSTDMADVQAIIPAIHPYISAATGKAHSESYELVDKELAYLGSAKVLAFTIIDLLWNDCEGLRAVKAAYKPKFTKEEYLSFWRDFAAGNK